MHHFFIPKFLGLCLVCIGLTGCEDTTLSSVPTQPDLKSRDSHAEYDQRGLLFSYPQHWQLVYDEPGLESDREVAFETPNSSRITVYFFKTHPKSLEEITNKLVEQSRLESSVDVTNYMRESIDLAQYRGERLSWTSSQMVEVRSELVIVEISTSPIPIFVQFYLFDSDIVTESVHMTRFIDGLKTDHQRVLL